MERDKHETPILFRKSMGEITAVFPEEPADINGQFMTCYAHVGQHSSCALEWYHSTTPARPEEYAGLLRELEGLGYRIKVVQKRTRQHVAAFNAQVDKWRRLGRG